MHLYAFLLASLLFVWGFVWVMWRVLWHRETNPLERSAGRVFVLFVLCAALSGTWHGMQDARRHYRLNRIIPLPADARAMIADDGGLPASAYTRLTHEQAMDHYRSPRLAAQGWQIESGSDAGQHASTLIIAKADLRVRISVRRSEWLEIGRNTPPTRIAFQRLDAPSDR